MDCNLLFLYQTGHSPDDDVGIHRHGCYEIVYYISGIGKTNINGKAFSYRKNTMALIMPDQPHNELHIENTEVIFIGFEVTGEIELPSYGIYDDNRHLSFLSYLIRMKDELTSRKSHYSTMVNFLLGELLIRLVRMMPHEKVNVSDFNYITQFIKENCNQSIDLDKLSGLSGYSYHRFRHLFKLKTGYSPREYIINNRILNARRLLCETYNSIDNISQECGFSNASQFSLMFKRATGLTPSAFRKINKA